MVFQSQNIAEAKIYGVELKAGLDFGALVGAVAKAGRCAAPRRGRAARTKPTTCRWTASTR